MALYQTAILNDEIARLQETVQQKKKKKETTRSFINSSTILTGMARRSDPLAGTIHLLADNVTTPALKPQIRLSAENRNFRDDNGKMNWASNAATTLAMPAVETKYKWLVLIVTIEIHTIVS
ncbi:hypothetical protein V1509DRAFT_668057 [Lipomyces kononenkoae]